MELKDDEVMQRGDVLHYDGADPLPVPPEWFGKKYQYLKTRPGGKKMKFKKGDRVRARRTIDNTILSDSMGTICHICSQNNIGVRWDKKREASDHDCSGYCTPGHGYWIFGNDQDLELIKGGKKMKEKKYPKKFYVQFDCPINDDDMNLSVNEEPRDLNTDYPMLEIKDGKVTLVNVKIQTRAVVTKVK